MINGGEGIDASVDLPSKVSKKRGKESSENDKSLEATDDTKCRSVTELSPKRGRISGTFVVVSPTNSHCSAEVSHVKVPFVLMESSANNSST